MCLLITLIVSVWDEALFEQARMVDDYMKSFINEDILRGQGTGIMTGTHFHHKTHGSLAWARATSTSAYLNLLTVSYTIPHYPAGASEKAVNG